MRKKYFGRSEAYMVFLVIMVLGSLLWAYSKNAEKQAKITQCSSNLVVIGKGMTQLYSNKENIYMPFVRGIITEGTHGGWYDLFSIPKESMYCPAERDRYNHTYAIHPFAAYGATYSKLNNATTAVLGDLTFHTADKSINVLYGDGHVASYVTAGKTGPYSGVYQIPNPADQVGYNPKAK